jgi:hypothetical protein
VTQALRKREFEIYDKGSRQTDATQAFRHELQHLFSEEDEEWNQNIFKNHIIFLPKSRPLYKYVPSKINK